MYTMFHTLTNVQYGAAVPLQQAIDNQNGNLRVGFVQSTILLDGLMLGHKRRSRGAPVAKRKSWGKFPFLPGSIAFYD